MFNTSLIHYAYLVSDFTGIVITLKFKTDIKKTKTRFVTNIQHTNYKIQTYCKIANVLVKGLVVYSFRLRRRAFILFVFILSVFKVET